MVVWIAFWSAFGLVLPQNVHFPFSGVFSPILGPFVLIGGIFGAGGLSYVALTELFIPATIFWVIVIFILKTNKISTS